MQSGPARWWNTEQALTTRTTRGDVQLADQNVDQRDKASARAKRRGAAALKRLIDTLGAEEQRHFEQSGWEGDAYDGQADPVDYVVLAGMVERAIQRGYIDASAPHREGFLRALTVLFTGLPDGVPTWDGWDPISTTEPAFTAKSAAERLTRQAAANCARHSS
jgi:hypothetical protein